MSDPKVIAQVVLVAVGLLAAIVWLPFAASGMETAWIGVGLGVTLYLFSEELSQYVLPTLRSCERCGASNFATHTHCTTCGHEAKAEPEAFSPSGGSEKTPQPPE